MRTAALVLLLPLALSSVAASAAPPGAAGLRGSPVAVCDGVPATIVGTSGDDRLRGTAGPDVIQAFEGDDVLQGLAGDDLLCGGVGADVLDAGRGQDTLWGGSDGDPGDHSNEALLLAGDRLTGGPGSDDMHGGPTPDDGDGFDPSYSSDVADYSLARSPLHATLPGFGAEGVVVGQGHDRLLGVYGFVGGIAGDEVVAGSGTRLLSGLGGDDDLLARTTTGETLGGPGDDVLRRGNVVRGGHGRDLIIAPVRQAYGDLGPDLLRGSKHRDQLYGGPGHDDLRGRGGDDTLDGQGGRDRVDGGADHDTCVGEVLIRCEAPRPPG